MASTIARTLERLRRSGWVHAESTQRRAGGASHDLFGFVDILAMRPPLRLLAVQATDVNHRGAHLDRMIVDPAVHAWLACGCDLELWAWRCLKPRGAARGRWEPDVTRFSVYGGTVAADRVNP